MEAAECSTWAQKTNIRKFVCIFLSKELWNLHMFHFSWSLRHQNELIRRLWLVSIARLEWNSLFCFRDFALGGNIWKSFQKYMFTCSACLSNVEVFHINKIWLFSVCSSIIANSEPHVSENYKIYAVPLICCKSGQLMFNSSELYLLICFYRNTGHFLVSQVFFFSKYTGVSFWKLTVLRLVVFKCSNTSILTENGSNNYFCCYIRHI